MERVREMMVAEQGKGAGKEQGFSLVEFGHGVHRLFKDNNY